MFDRKKMVYIANGFSIKLKKKNWLSLSRYIVVSRLHGQQGIYHDYNYSAQKRSTFAMIYRCIQYKKQ